MSSLKSSIKKVLHSIFGFERFLYYFSLFKIYTLKIDVKENGIFQFINKVNESKREGIILDIGANIGITCGVIARNSEYKIYAYEPLPLNYNILEKVIARLKISDRVQVYKMALGNTDGYCDMVLPVVEDVRMHGLSHVIDESITDFNEGQKIEKVPIRKLDSIIKSQQIVGIKLDVENFEFEVLKGAKELLMSQRPVIYTELWENDNRKNCFSFLESLGYDVFYCKNNYLIKYEEGVIDVQTFMFV